MVEVVGAEDDRLALGREFPSDRNHRRGRHGVEPAGGFVVDQHVRVVYQRARDPDLPFHPLREVTNLSVPGLEVQPIEEVLDAGFGHG